MKRPTNYQKYLTLGQTVEMELAQKEINAISWTDYRVCYRNPEISQSDGVSKIIWAIDNTGELVVIKKMPLTHVQKANDLEKISRETETHSEIYAQSCKHIPEKRRFRPHGNFFFAATEYVEHGFDMLKKKRVSGAHGLEDIITAFTGYCSALEYMHNVAQVVHRDINPSNLRFDINEDNEIVSKIIDFGLACGINASLSNTGKVGYLPPEKERQGVTSEVYSLGICLYEAISGTDETIVNEQQTELRSKDDKLQATHSTIENSGLGPEEKYVEKSKANIRRFHETRKPQEEIKYLFEIFKKATQPEPKDRYQNATEFKNDLKIALQQKRLDELILAFEHASTASEKIRKSMPFDLTLANEASKKKKVLYEEFKKEHVDLQSSAVIAFVEAQIKEKLKPIKDAANVYLNQFRFTTALSAGLEGMESYSKKIEEMLEAGNPAYRRNIFEMVTKLKEMYDLCEINCPLMFKVLLESRVLRREALKNQVKISYDELMKKTEQIKPVAVLLEDSEYNEPAIISSRLGEYLSEIEARDSTANDLQHCLEIKTLLKNQEKFITVSDDRLSSRFKEFMQKLDAYISKAPKEILGPTFFNMGLESFNEGDLKKSAANFEEAKKHFTAEKPQVEYNLGRIYQELRENTVASMHYRNASKVLKSQNAGEPVSLINNRAVLFAKSGSHDAARQLLEIALAQAPDDCDLLYNLAQTYRETGNSAAAITLLKQVLANNPSNEIHNFLAQEYFKVEDFSKFKEHAEAYINAFIEKKQSKGDA